MITPYQPVNTDAREELLRRKDFHERKAKEYGDIVARMDSLISFFSEHRFPEEPLTHESSTAPAPAPEEPPMFHFPPQHRSKEIIYDEEIKKLLHQVKIASKIAVYQHFHQAFRGNTSIGAVESYLKRAVVRGVILRVRRGEYGLPPETD